VELETSGMKKEGGAGEGNGGEERSHETIFVSVDHPDPPFSLRFFLSRPRIIVRTTMGYFKNFLCFTRPTMTPRDRMLLSPWQKWTKYYRFPWKVVLHFILFLFVAIQVGLQFAETAQYARASHNTFSSLFFNKTDFDSYDVKFHTIDDLIWNLNTTVMKFYNISNVSVDMYAYNYHHNSTHDRVLDRPTMDVEAYDSGFFDYDPDKGWYNIDNSMSSSSESYTLTEDNPLGPFGTSNITELHSLFYRLISIKLKIALVNMDVSVLGPVPFLWHWIAKYKKTGGEIQASYWMDQDYFSQTSYAQIKATRIQFSFAISIIFICGVCFYFSFLSSVKNLQAYIKIRKQYKSIPDKTMEQEQYPYWEDISLSVKLSTLDLWTFWMIVAEAALVVSCILALCDYSGFFPNKYSFFEIFQGIGALMITVNLVRYLEYKKNFYTLILTLKLSLPRITRFIISAAPLFIGYLLMGVILFAPYESHWETVTDAAITLFAMLNGDDLMDTIFPLNISYPYPTVSTIYWFTFIALFITAVLNVFIFIIEDSFDAAKEFNAMVERRKDIQSGTYTWKHDDPREDDDADDFDLFTLFWILDREFNDQDYTSSFSSSDSDSEGPDFPQIIIQKPAPVTLDAPDLEIVVDPIPIERGKMNKEQKDKDLKENKGKEKEKQKQKEKEKEKEDSNKQEGSEPLTDKLHKHPSPKQSAQPQQEPQSQAEPQPQSQTDFLDSPEDMELEEKTSESEDSEHELEVDKDRLNSLHSSLIAISEGENVEGLHSLYTNVYRIIYYHRNNWNKNQALNELEEFLKSTRGGRSEEV